MRRILSLAELTELRKWCHKRTSINPDVAIREIKEILGFV